MINKAIDILAFGAHADDIEIGMGGTVAKYASEGKSIVFCDLTQAELSSNGTVELRKQEAFESANLLGVKERINLQLPDRGLFLLDSYIRKITSVIRYYRPKVIFAPYEVDRHPDHGNCSKLIQEAFFSAGIRKYETEDSLQQHKSKALYFYMINGFHHPDFCVDISQHFQTKIKSLQSYKSQFVFESNGVETPLTNGYIETVEGRDRMMGKEVSVPFAEGFISSKPLILNKDLLGDVQ
ncbi:bacillithiol biosynthesis deacetylase BshB1 [Oikeobacillus pervagus]|uniref:Bacillithiol biosynthesis deacetylase BshB1 n=1 Tax=Oikeobacillus pervagus TaxID=1325931 RepID=A0AAJ1SW24_9BACI|nr:bacillithiol biosynthesis deacetylase BshB1 [Oikeobacillus pervagus]